MMAEQIYVSPNRCKNEKELNNFIDATDKEFCQRNFEQSDTIGFDWYYRKQVWTQYHEFFGFDVQAAQIVSDWLKEACAALGMPAVEIAMNTIYEKALQRVKNDLSDDIPSIEDLYVDGYGDDVKIDYSQTYTLENIKEELQEMYETKGEKWFKEKDNFAVREIFSLLEIDFADYAEKKEIEKEVKDFLNDFPNETEWNEAFKKALSKSSSNNFAALIMSEQRAYVLFGYSRDFFDGTQSIKDLEEFTCYFNIENMSVDKDGVLCFSGKLYSDGNEAINDNFKVKMLTDEAFEEILRKYEEEISYIKELLVPNSDKQDEFLKEMKELYNSDATIKLEIENIESAKQTRKNR